MNNISSQSKLDKELYDLAMTVVSEWLAEDGKLNLSGCWVVGHAAELDAAIARVLSGQRPKRHAERRMDRMRQDKLQPATAEAMAIIFTRATELLRGAP